MSLRNQLMVIAIATAIGVSIICVAMRAGTAYRERPCPEWADRPVVEVPARCADYFNLTTTKNGDQ